MPYRVHKIAAICLILLPAKTARTEPPFPPYLRTKQTVALYRQMAATRNAVNLPSLRKAVKPGDDYPYAPQLAEWLVFLGDMPRGISVPNLRYDGLLVEAVQRFQTRHGLEPDGVLGKATLSELNTPLTHRVRQLELSLARWRDVPESFSRPPIIVNIPEFRLRALDENLRTALTMKVVVGQSSGHQTPVLTAQMKYLIFRPYWDVPASIVTEELLPKLDDDPDYFIRNHFEFVPASGGGTRVRQLPGADNALGGVKFILPNEHDVYLHATPATNLFRKFRRDFSHGCIRVEKPEDLAAWVLRDQPAWTPERIQNAMNGASPLTVNLTSPVPVLIVYGTAVVSEDGVVHFYRDIYGLDTPVK